MTFPERVPASARCFLLLKSRFVTLPFGDDVETYFLLGKCWHSIARSRSINTFYWRSFEERRGLHGDLTKVAKNGAAQQVRSISRNIAHQLGGQWNRWRVKRRRERMDAIPGRLRFVLRLNLLKECLTPLTLPELGLNEFQALPSDLFALFGMGEIIFAARN